MTIALLLISALTLFSGAPFPVNAGSMIWSMVDTPSDSYFNVIVSPCEINALASGMDGRILYAVDTANLRLYRSDDGGASWTDITNNLTAGGAALPAWNIALAPDNPSFVAVVTSTGGLPRRVFASIDGGQNWYDTNCPAAANIGAISISFNYGNYDVAAGTRTGGGAGTVYCLKGTSPGGTWVDQGLAGDVFALKFSPNYRTDSSISVVYGTLAGTFFNVGIRDPNTNTTNWNTVYGGNPPEITAAGAGTSPLANQVITADLELPLDFSGQAPSLCRAFISIDATGGNPGVYRIDNNIVYQLMAASGNKRISSIAYFGTYAMGKLLCGEVRGDPARATVMTWFTDAPNTCPATCWYPAEKPPTGAGTSGYGNAQVLWSPDGSLAYCGTSSALLNAPGAWPAGYANIVPLDESAFSISRDSGRTWNQLSLIDTRIDSLGDVVVSEDSSIMYLASINTTGATNFDSIWRSSAQATARSWERVLCFTSASNDVILRMSNTGNDQAVFFASRNTQDFRQSQDQGQIWKEMLPGSNITDFTVTSINNVRYVYVLSGIFIRRCNVTSLIPQWSSQIATGLNAAHTIFATPTNLVIVGGDVADSSVSFSIDGGNSFSRTSTLPVPGQVHAIVDYRFPAGALIYAASNGAGSNIYAWLIGAPVWNEMQAPNLRYWSLAQMNTLYGVADGGTNSVVDRSINPEAVVPPDILWDVLNTGLQPGVVFTREPVALKLSSGVNLWAIDNRAYNFAAGTGRLWHFCDCLSGGPTYKPPPPPPKEVLFAAPVAVAPGPDNVIPIYLEDNSIGQITFEWKHNTAAGAYELWLARDNNFTKLLEQVTVSPQYRRSPEWTLPDNKDIKQGETYYWKVRVTQAATGEKGSGEWSNTLSFSVAENKPKGTVNVVPPVTVTGNITGKIPARPTADNAPSTGILSFLQNNLWIPLLGVLLIILIIIAFLAGRKSARKI
ncbi:MAG: hypothetical protein PHO26_08530 [Dehalococcoidia bacterium]|nr:hypothetical protein [Dehalococcoidia bacterium]MDD5493115.1 hypothetical protein [Dehalococcoidia bacterium]